MVGAQNKVNWGIPQQRTLSINSQQSILPYRKALKSLPKNILKNKKAECPRLMLKKHR